MFEHTRKDEPACGGMHPGSKLTPEDVEFADAVTRWRMKHKRYPTWSDVLTIAKSLGYRKEADRG